MEPCGDLRGERVDQVLPGRRSPSGHQVVSLDSLKDLPDWRRAAIVILARGDIVESAGIRRACADGVNGGIQKANWAVSLFCGLLVDQRRKSCPPRGRETGSAPGGLACSKLTAEVVAVSLHGDVGDVAPDGRADIGGVGDACLPSGYGYAVGADPAARAVPGRLRKPGPSRIGSDQVRSTHRGDILVLG